VLPGCRPERRAVRVVQGVPDSVGPGRRRTAWPSGRSRGSAADARWVSSARRWRWVGSGWVATPTATRNTCGVASFALSALVLGYHPASRYAPALRTRPWPTVVTEPGFRLGNVDPALHPKGSLAAQALRQAGIDPATAIPMPEDTLLARLQTGQLDAAFFYTTEAPQAAIPTIPVAGNALHATYTITMLNHAANPAGAAAFVNYLLGPAGRAILHAHGVQLIPPTVSGEPTAVPASVRPTLSPR
jgi:Bacterial extracellular solute-binding protein